LEAARSVEPHLKTIPLSRYQFRLAGPQQDTEKLLAAKPLCRRRGNRADPSQAPQDAASTAGPHCRRPSAAADELEMKFPSARRHRQSGGDQMSAAFMIKGIEALTLECFLAASRADLLER